MTSSRRGPPASTSNSRPHWASARATTSDSWPTDSWARRSASLEIWLAIELLGLSGGILAALLYNSVSRGVTQLAVFIPGRIGIMEAAQATVFAALGLGSTNGLALALALRFRYIVNLLVSHGALARVHILAERFPPRAAELTRAENSPSPPPDGSLARP